ncbi:flagellar hook-length control protein FliK [Paenibacillus septentrionalis]|uniref:Flagellar hook-length control protein FliK n=1 Tax=Paenibacillus septentrionalis TaxID=429342 RepID=A0ABW1V0E8_9BACL
MDVMNLLTGGALVGNPAQIAASNSTAVDGAAFQKQLQFSLAGNEQAEAEKEANASQLFAFIAPELTGSKGSVSAGPITAEQLNALLEKLLDQLEELDQLELGGEHLEVIDSLLQQIQALIAVISLNSDTSRMTADDAISNTNQDAKIEMVVKLQDQLLVLQQALQSGASKVLNGQSVEQLVADQLQVVQDKVTVLLQDAKMKQSAAVHNDTLEATESGTTAFVAKDQKAAASEQISHLQRLSQEASYAQAAKPTAGANASVSAQTAGEDSMELSASVLTSQADGEQETQPQVTSKASEAITASTGTQADDMIQPTTPVALLRADQVRDLLPQLVRTDGTLSSAFVLADEFADTMEGLIVHRFNVSELNGVTEARLMLTPENLGHVDVKISMQNGVLTAMFQTETAMAKDALENQMLQLRASLAAQGITVEKIEVSHSEFASQLNQQQKQGSQGNHGQDGSSNRGNREERFEDELILNTASQELGFGRAVNETI